MHNNLALLGTYFEKSILIGSLKWQSVAKRSFASKIRICDFLTLRAFKLRFAQPFIAKFKSTTNWSLYALG